MNTQSEYALEESLIAQLEGMEYSRVVIENEAGMLANLKSQLQIHNKLPFTNNEFSRILNHLNTGGVFERAKVLRDRFALKRDDDSVN
jgi:type I restriction enzyme R subunit